MAFYNRQPRDPGAMDPRLSTTTAGAIVSFFAIVALVALAMAGYYLFNSSVPTNVADMNDNSGKVQPVPAPPTPTQR